MTTLRRAFRGLHARLLLAHLLVIAVGLVTVYAAASITAPRFFERQMQNMMERNPNAASRRAAIQSGQSAGQGAGQGAAQGQGSQAGRGPGPGPGAGAGLGPGGRFGMMSEELEQRVADSYLASLTDALLLAGGAALVAAVVASVLVSRGIANPIHKLAGASHRVAAGHYDERVPVEGTTEVHQLATSFNAMAAAVEDAERRRQELIGDVAHEMRTPIATLEGYLEGLLDGVIEPTDRVWAKLHDEAGRLRRLIEDLQELSRAEAHQLSVVCRATAPAAIVQPAVDRLEADVAERGLSLKVDLPPNLPAVEADPERAVQVLTNLMTNALRYTPPPGEIAVRVAADADKGVVRFEVADSGIGIEPEHLPRVFERFYRVDKSRSRALGGAGVGLTIAQALVETMGGQISAQSAGPGKGSTFTFELPTAA